MNFQQKALPILVAAVAASAVAGLGAKLTVLGPWYQGLTQPGFKPPDMWFGPVWTFIFTLTAIAGVLAWQRAPNAASRRWLVGLFAVNAGLNTLWSVLFFKLQRPDWSLIEMGFLWLSIAALMLVMKPYARTASLCLLPYLLWVTFAAAINLAVVRLNGPFG